MEDNNIIEFFDCNVRLGLSHRPEDYSFQGPEQLIQRMDYYNIDNVLAYHVEAISQPVLGNKLLISEIKNYDRIFGCAVLTPPYTGEFGDINQYFKDLAEANIRAIRLFPTINNFPLKAYCLDNILQQAEIYKMPVLIDCIDINDKSMPYSPWNYSPDYDLIYELAMEYTKVNFIIIMPGMLTQRTQFSIMAKCPNIYFECTSFGYKNIEHVCKLFTSDKLVFGTYSPQLESGAFICYILYANISIGEKIEIAAGNLKRLLGVE